MTFKHVKFEDSPTMRALEKVAKEKGLVKPEPLQKKASMTKKADYTPSSDFMENIFKLCAGLRANGLEKAAAEVETNYLRFKQAQTLYETSKEKGEDLVQSAHPKGSHKLEGVEGEEATVEDILDQHKKITEVVEKKPSGKLSSAQIISEVKKALGQVAAPKETESEINAKIDGILAAMPRQFGAVVTSVNRYGDSDWATINKSTSQEKAAQVYNVLGVRPFDRTQYNALTKAFSDFVNWASDTGAFEDSVWHSSEHNAQSKELWNSNVGPFVVVVRNAIKQLNDWLVKRDTIRTLVEQGTYQDPGEKSKPITIAPVEIHEGPLGPVYRQINGLKRQLSTWATYRSISSDPEAAKWIADEIKELDGIMARMEKIPEDPESEKEAAANFQSEVSKEQASINEFKTGWVDQK